MDDTNSTPTQATAAEGDPFKAVRRGLLEFAVLTALVNGRLYPAEIRERLASTPFATQEGTLYPLLGKLRRDGMLDHVWEESESGPPRKYHGLTELGHARREQLGTYWLQLATTIESLGAPR